MYSRCGYLVVNNDILVSAPRQIPR